MQNSDLKWQCRRGMKELDVVIERFISNDYNNLDNEQKTVFRQLLEEDDGLLFSWIIGVEEPKDKQQKEILNYLVSCAKYHENFK